jgi:hypothetical protein
MCGHKLGASNAIAGFDQGNICNCSSCQFEYTKTPEWEAQWESRQCINGLDGHGGHTYDNNRCMICDLAEAKDRIAALEAIIEDDGRSTARVQAEVIAAELIPMIYRATIDAFNMPLEKLIGYVPTVQNIEAHSERVSDALKVNASAEQMSSERVELPTNEQLENMPKKIEWLGIPEHNHW